MKIIKRPNEVFWRRFFGIVSETSRTEKNEFNGKGLAKNRVLKSCHALIIPNQGQIRHSRSRWPPSWMEIAGIVAIWMGKSKAEGGRDAGPPDSAQSSLAVFCK